MDPSYEKTPDPRLGYLTGALLGLLIVAAGLTAYLTFAGVRDFVTSWEMTSLPGVVIRDTAPTPDSSGQVSDLTTPLQPVTADAPPPVMWDGSSRVTMLVMGLDYRDWLTGEGPPHTDTMILVTIDPLNRTAGMLSIPRDLWVNIPGFEYGRINGAYMLGEMYKYEPGAGPGLAMATVEELLGVPIDFYAQIDFEAFVQFVDEIGGVKVNITEPIKVDPRGDDNNKTLKPGVQTLPGDLALAYIRARKGSGDDFGRAQRQQDVILSIRNKVLSPENLPVLIAKSGTLYNQLAAGVHTNLTLDQAIKLAWLAQQIPPENIRKGVIGPPDQVLLAASPTGDQVLKPVTEKIRMLRDEVFADSAAAASPAASMSLADLMKAENARVSVYNATQAAGLATRTADYLKAQGANVTETQNAGQVATNTEITFYTGKPYTVKFLADLMKVNGIHIFYVFDPNSPVDVMITLGTDWAGQNPLP